MPLLVDHINEGRDRLKQGYNGPHFKDIRVFLDNLETEAIALITLKVTFDKVFSKSGHNLIHKVTDAIGTALEAECQLRHYQETVPALYTYIKNTYWHEASGTKQKYVDVKTKMSHFDVKTWTAWGQAKRIKLGGCFLDKLIEVTQWFEKRPVRGHNHSTIAIVPTESFLEHRDDVMRIAELFSPLLWPMLIEPKDWSYYRDFNGEKKLRYGGYYLNKVMKGNDLVRRGKSTIIQGEEPLKFLNQIQKVSYRINTFVLDVAENLYENRINVGKFIPVIEVEIPPKPLDIDTNKESEKSWRKQAKEAHNKNARAFRKSCRTRMTLEAARRFRDESSYYIPWSFDYRGRTYPIPSFLTPQDTDFGKALIRFAEEKPLTNDGIKWLAFHVATTYGKDKDTIEDRRQWVDDNLTLISAVAQDPIRNRAKWDSVEEPWQFLAACDEYYHCVMIKDRLTTGLPIAIDATCSGLQILAGLALDESTAKLVNVVPDEEPQDAYKRIARESKPNIPEKLHEHWDRKCTKRSVMTIPYNAKPFSNRSYIREALKLKEVEIDKEDLTQTVRAVRDAMVKVVPGPMAVMKWIETEVAKSLKVKKYLEWTTPSGFIVHQEIMKYDDTHQERIQLQLLGKCVLRLNKLTDQPYIDRHRAATAPNLIHSLDATLLHIAVPKFKHPIALIHDSVLCLANDMDSLNYLVRETYNKLFTKDSYLKTFADYIGAETEPPIVGDLEPSDVLTSTYFFC